MYCVRLRQLPAQRAKNFRRFHFKNTPMPRPIPIVTYSTYHSAALSLALLVFNSWTWLYVSSLRTGGEHFVWYYLVTLGMSECPWLTTWLQMLKNLFPKVGWRRNRPTSYKWLYWSPTMLFFLLHFYEVKQIAGQSMKVCSQRSAGLDVLHITPCQLADAQPRFIHTERHLFVRSLLHTHPPRLQQGGRCHPPVSTRNAEVQTYYDRPIRCPDDPNRTIIKRIVALEGDTVKTRPPCLEPEVKIPQGHVWVEGPSRLLPYAFSTLRFF